VDETSAKSAEMVCGSRR